MNFNELNLSEKVMKGIEDAGFVECTPVQEKTYEHSLKGRDVCVQSQTGTGKTAAFLISIFENLQSEVRSGMSMIIVPTRELAVQIEDEARLLGGNLDLKIVSVYGGVGYKGQEEVLRQNPDIIIGTPGRLIDFGKSGKIKFEKVSTLVIDEADRLFDMGFLPDLKIMLKRMPGVKERMTMLFSATLSTKVRHLAWEYMNEPGEVEISPEKITVEAIAQELYHVAKEEKLKLLLGLLKRDNPENALVFCNTKHMAVELAWRLSENGYKCQYLMGDLPQKKRLQVLNRVKAGELQFLVATDVAARGLHINDLSMVVNYDIPEDYENYVHRIGRTARAGKTGKAVTLACEKYVYGLEPIEKYINMKIPVFGVEDSLFVKDVSAGKFFKDTDRYINKGRDSRDSRGRSSSPGRGGNRKPGYDKTRRDRKPNEKRGAAGDRSERKPSGSGTTPGYNKSSRPERKRHSPVPAGDRADNRTTRNPGQSENTRAVKNVKPARKPKTGASVDDRLAYYRAKYGEDFKAPEAVSPGKSSEIKGSFFSKLGRKLGIGKKKKK